MVTEHSLNVLLHIGAGIAGLSLGLIPLLSEKGGQRHRYWGRYFASFAGLVMLTALMAILFWNPPAALAAVALSASYQLISGVRALQLRDTGPRWQDALLASAALLIVAVLFCREGYNTASWPPIIGHAALGYVATIALYDLSRHGWPQLWLRAVRPLDHGLKMTGVFFAMLSAGVGNSVRSFQPWSQLLPSALGFMVMLWFGLRYAIAYRQSSTK